MRATPVLLTPVLLTPALLILALLAAAPARAQSFVEYPSHPATYGDHTVPATWVGGPSAVTVTFLADETILHADGNGQSQRTARNTLNFTPPWSPANPQDYDDPRIVGVYGSRLPLLQQMAADGSCTLRYAFTTPVTVGLDLFLTDIDTADSLTVTAFDSGGAPLDLSGWGVRARADLSNFKNTGTGFSSIVAPHPLVTIAPGAITLAAADANNYNRSVTVLAVPAGPAVGRIDVTFRGIQNSASRAEAGTGSHVYLGISTSLGTTGAPITGIPEIRLITPNPARSGRVGVALALEKDTSVRWSIYDVMGRLAARPFDARLGAAAHDLWWDGRDAGGARVPAGVYLLRVDRVGAQVGWTRRLLILN